MQNFDSRALGITDTYGQRFMREGTYRYNIVAAGCGDLNEEFPYVLEVGGAREEMQQHLVSLVPDGRRLAPDPPELRIAVGDLVTWACRVPAGPAFTVTGERDFFGSDRLYNESGYAHAFGTAGEFRWVDVYGSGLSGVVRVVEPQCRSKDEFAEWRERLRKGHLVMINGEEANPRELEIETGQTVYFAVTKAPGISITDAGVADVTARPRKGDREQAAS